MLDDFSEVFLLLPEDWEVHLCRNSKTEGQCGIINTDLIPEEMCKLCDLPAEWKQFLGTKRPGAFPEFP